KAVEDMRLPGDLDFERFIIVVPADFAFRHGSFSLWRLSVYAAKDRLRPLHSGCAQAHLPVAFSVCCLVHASLQYVFPVGTSQVQTACWQSFMVTVGVSCVNCNEGESGALSYRCRRRIWLSFAPLCGMTGGVHRLSSLRSAQYN